MGSKRHPLDIFRSTDEGFVSASREKRRRKITGKVLTSSSRPVAQPARPTPMATKVTGSPSVPRISSATFDLLRRGGYLSAALVLVVGMVWSVQTFLGDGSTALSKNEKVPDRSKTEVLGDGYVDPAETSLFTIRASVYPGTAQARAIALEAADRLEDRGFSPVEILAIPDPDQADATKSYELIVGAARGESDLDGTLARLRAISDWPGGKPVPFAKALVIAHPLPSLVDGDLR